MGVLSELEPASVFRYFEEICAIPHGSGNTKQISDYCVRFAVAHGLRYIQDECNNVIIFKDAAAGYEKARPVILQGHLDMVCEKTADSAVDPEKDGLALRAEEGVVFAEGTTLGGDDGIAIAYALAILAADDIPHPPLEVVLTVDEEIGMLGAAGLDCSPLKGRIMLNLDSEEEGVLLVGCAGGVNAVCRFPVLRRAADGVEAVLEIGGLIGGHSGVEIHKGRANANVLLGRALKELRKAVPYALVSVSGGLKDNAIPREAAARLVLRPEDLEAAKKLTVECHELFAAEYRDADPQLALKLSFGGEGSCRAMEEGCAERIVSALTELPNGVQSMSGEIPGLVQTSLNMGILQTAGDEVVMSYSVRSSVGAEKKELVDRLAALTARFGGTMNCTGDYPAWEYRRDSLLKELMIEVFERQYGYPPSVEAIHAGVECGLFAGKLPELDCVSFGPNIRDIHTTEERLEIASVQRTWNYVLEVLRRLG